MTKKIAEHSHALSIFWLKKNGYLNKNLSLHSGGITWTSGWSDDKNSIGFSVIKENLRTPEEITRIELNYTHTDYWTKEKADMKYRVDLITTACNYGGTRYWFICPLIRNGNYCGKRIGVLYSVDKYFGCRNCANIAYAAQMDGGRLRPGSHTISDMEKLEMEIKRYYYRGKPTRKYRRLMKMQDMLNRDFIAMAAILNRRV